MKLNFNCESMIKHLEEMPYKTDAAIKMFAETNALVLQNEARQKAPWQDRTGHARQRLRGYSTHTISGYRINLAHGVDYGLWLELAHEKRFAILEPTITLSSPRIMTEFQGFMSKLK
jgi:hypothetical protein